MYSDCSGKPDLVMTFSRDEHAKVEEDRGTLTFRVVYNNNEPQMLQDVIALKASRSRSHVVFCT